jgi:hypothetical protein
MKQRLLQKFDKDGDGKLNEDERKAARAAMQQQTGRGKGERGKMRPGGPGRKGAGQKPMGQKPREKT